MYKIVVFSARILTYRIESLHFYSNKITLSELQRVILHTTRLDLTDDN